MSNIPKQVFEIESIQEEQNEIDSINNSSRRFQGHIPVYPAQDTTYQNGGFSSYDQNQRQAQLNYIYQQQQNLNYMQNNNGNQLTPVQMYMKEKLIAYQNQSNQANSGSLIIHNEKLDTSSQITNTIDKNLEQHYQNIQSQNMMTSDGYEYTSPNVIVPQRLFQNAVQQNQLNSQNTQNIQQQQKLQQQQQQQQQQYLQQQQKLQQAQYQQQQNMNGNYQARDSTNQSNQTAQQQQQQQQYQLQMNQQQQLLQQQQMQLQQQQQYANVHDQLIDQQSSEEIQYINQSQQSINNNNFNSLRQSNTSVPSITKNYFVVNPVHESVKKMQDKLTHKPAVKQVQQQTKAKSRQNGKENSANKNQNLQQEREQPTTNENEQSQNLQNLQNQVVQQQQLQAPKHIYLNLDQLNQASKKNSKTASVSNIKKATPLKQHPSKPSVNGDKHSSKAPSRQSQQSSVVNKNKNTSNRVSEQIYPPPPSKISSAATPQNEIQESVQNDEIDEYNLNQQQQIILNGSNEKKKVVNSLLDSKKTYLDVRTSKQKELIKHANQQQVIKQSLQDTLKNQQYTNGTSNNNNNNNNNTNNQILDNEMQVADIYQLQQQQQITNHSQKEYKQEARLQNNSGNRTATPKAQQQSNVSNRKPSSQTLIASKSLPQFVTQESLANSAKERQNFEFITKGDKTVEIRSKDNSFAGSSSQFQSKLGSPHSVSTLQNNNKLNQSTYTQQQFGQSNYFGILTSPKTKLSEANFYKKETILERNDFWVKHTDTHKQLLNMHYVGEEMKECSFSPMFYTNNLNRKCAVKHQNLTQRVEQSLNPTFHKQAAQMKSSYSRLHNFKKEMGFIEQMIQQKPTGNNEQNQYDQANLEQYQ